MELDHSSVHDVIHPTAAFAQSPPGPVDTLEARHELRSWLDSQLNPKNRIDRLDPPANPLWRIDGCTALGTQFYAIPVFLTEDFPPLRFDVFIAESEATSNPVFRQLLDLSVAFHTKDATRLNRLGITKHVLRILQAWTQKEAAAASNPDSFASGFEAYPFGSHIILENLDLDISKVKVTIAKTFYLERQLLALSELPAALGIEPGVVPPDIDIFRLSIVQQLHDSVCVVRIRDSEDDTRWIFKALTSGTKFLYCELRNLLRMEPHPNVISKPKYLVTKNCAFGNKEGVVGFIVPYHSAGSLRDALPLLRIHNQLTPHKQMTWAKQLASAVLHIRERGNMFYPDLRLDNVVRSATDDLVMVDFEQRGVWCEFAAPEINAVSYVHILATDGQDREEDDPTCIPVEKREYFSNILSRVLPEWKALEASEDYNNLDFNGGTTFNVPWMALDAREQEAAEVYMLARVLWCIFEGQCAPQNAAVWQSYKREPEYEFPEYRHTPPGIRDLIDQCTKGRRATLSSLVTRVGGKLLLRTETGVKEDSTAEEVRSAAKEFWKGEVWFAVEFLKYRDKAKASGTWDSNSFGRPRLREVVERLEELSKNL
ncbi:ribosomal protein S6 kinase alpha-5 [Podospora australis]|uniref:Ribosomal protein S6 kinase alpha-5 n=1 Tax=Podospora australis TaxID=1536484 RepID=A0AAN6X0U7_9PEZI|nr:ribosomal protein S6 kinase alpha-5 [Podospora australis]